MLQTNLQENGNSVFYTPCEEVNTMLNHFVQNAEKNDIWASIDAAGLRKDISGNSFSEMLHNVLEQASLGCVENTLPKNRFIRLRSRVMQKRLFLRVQYSCTEMKQEDLDMKFVEIQKLLTSMDGYFKILPGNDIMDIEVSIPVS